jgi:hypothetical protein
MRNKMNKNAIAAQICKLGRGSEGSFKGRLRREMRKITKQSVIDYFQYKNPTPNMQHLIFSPEYSVITFSIKIQHPICSI